MDSLSFNSSSSDTSQGAASTSQVADHMPVEVDFIMGGGDVSLSSMDGLNFISESESGAQFHNIF